MPYCLPKVEEIEMLFRNTLVGLCQDMLSSTALSQQPLLLFGFILKLLARNSEYLLYGNVQAVESHFLRTFILKSCDRLVERGLLGGVSDDLSNNNGLRAIE